MSSTVQRFIRIGTLRNVKTGTTRDGDVWLHGEMDTLSGERITLAAFGEKAEQLIPLSQGRVQLFGYFRPKRLCPVDGPAVVFQQFWVLHSKVGHDWASLPAEDLARLVWTHPVRALATMFDVSDVAIGKRCKQLSIAKPGRGFWAQVYSGDRPHPRGVPQAA